MTTTLGADLPFRNLIGQGGVLVWMRTRFLVLLVLELALVCCQSAPSQQSATVAPSAERRLQRTDTTPEGSRVSVEDPQPTDGGCGSTQAYLGPTPDWLQEATGHNVPRGLPYAVATPPIAAAFLFAQPLRAGHPENPSNKIMWVVRTPRDGSSLDIEGQPLAVGVGAPAVHVDQPANSGPGEIYPSIVDVPSPGCWQFALRWANGRAEIHLLYQAS